MQNVIFLSFKHTTTYFFILLAIPTCSYNDPEWKRQQPPLPLAPLQVDQVVVQLVEVEGDPEQVSGDEEGGNPKQGVGLAVLQAQLLLVLAVGGCK